MGEPLNNYESVAEALNAMKDSRQFNLKAGVIFEVISLATYLTLA